MKRSALFAILTLIAACSPVSRQQALPGEAVSFPRAVGNTNMCDTVLSFNGTNGANPGAGLVASGGLLYGTTMGGGYGDGTLFSMTPSGQETLVHSFYQEGDQPDAPVTPVRKNLYGTTGYGGTDDQGTVFAIKTNGKVLWTYSFKGLNAKDGIFPTGAPIEVSGMLYGTTTHGSTGNSGVVYSVVPQTGVEHVIYRFNGKQGRMPYGNLIEFHKTLWGTTEQGGKDFGTVFSITTAGKLTTIYNFEGAAKSDGENPYAGLVELNHKLYGTTEYGGANGTGTVFSIRANGRERVVYSFGATSSGDGAYPVSALYAYDGNLYGTTLNGGPYNDGTVFEVTPSGTERQLCSFDATGSMGMKNPNGSVVELNGEFYGTAEFGGPNNEGGVFSLAANAARLRQ